MKKFKFNFVRLIFKLKKLKELFLTIVELILYNKKVTTSDKNTMFINRIQKLIEEITNKSVYEIKL